MLVLVLKVWYLSVQKGLRSFCLAWETELYVRLREAVITEEQAAYDALIRLYRHGDIFSLAQRGILLSHLTVVPDGTLFRMFRLR